MRGCWNTKGVFDGLLPLVDGCMCILLAWLGLWARALDSPLLSSKMIPSQPFQPFGNILWNLWVTQRGAGMLWDVFVVSTRSGFSLHGVHDWSLSPEDVALDGVYLLWLSRVNLEGVG